MTTIALNLLRVQKKVKEISFPEVNWKMVMITGFLMCLVLLVFYVWQVNILTRGSYLINSYEKQINSLSEENKNLQVAFASASFWGQITPKIEALNFQKANSIKYIQVPDQSVAQATNKPAD